MTDRPSDPTSSGPDSSGPDSSDSASSGPASFDPASSDPASSDPASSGPASPVPTSSDPASTDPVRQRRARIAALVSLGQRVGYGLFAVAIVLFVIGLLTDFPGTVAAAIVACLVLGSLVLAPSIVFGYAVKAAEREDRERGL